MQPGASIPYRAEIDGLRAVAVIPVIFFHAGFSIFSGGFVGVDIFFVISGYLITAIILSELENGSFSLIRFYERRARRILPALFVVMACCIPFAWLWMEPGEYRAFGKSLAAMALFGSNFLFWRQSNYFASDANEKPLLHTWSLSVEEQFYLLFPLLLLLLWRFGRDRVLFTVTALAAVSLLLSEFGRRYAPAANFYLAPTRAWELYAGAICAFALGKRTSLRFGPINNLFSLIGLGMIAAATFFFGNRTPVPSFYTLIPVVGTCLIILFADSSTWMGRILAIPFLVGLGLISYSAYLWHQPLFAFAKIRILGEPSSALMLSLAVLSLGLAFCTWRFIERPFRTGGSTPFVIRKHVFGLAAAASCVLITIGLAIKNEKSYLSGLSGKAAYYEQYLRYWKNPGKKLTHWRDECHLSSRRSSLEAGCLHIKTGKSNYLLTGDSHAAHISLAIREAFPDENFLQATAAGCRPFITPSEKNRCDKFFASIFRDFVPNHKINGVILAAEWESDHKDELDATLTWLSKYTKRIIVIGPAIRYKADLPKILRDYERFGESKTTLTELNLLDSTRYATNDIIRDVTQKHGAKFIDVLPVLCPHKECQAITESGEPMFFDRTHLTLGGSQALVSKLIKSEELKLHLPGKQRLTPLDNPDVP